MSGKCSSIGQDTIISNNAVMSHMYISHEQTVLPYFGFVIGFCSPVDGYKLPYGSVISDLHYGFFTGILQILRDC